jgi:carbon monoxide dehydrogenase subunit G
MAMEFSGEYRIPARQQQVWDALNDPAVLQACIVGCKQLEKLSDTELFATVVATVGPISATFKGNVVLSDLDAPNGYTLTGQGQGGAAGFAKMAAKVSLSEDQNETVLKTWPMPRLVASWPVSAAVWCRPWRKRMRMTSLPHLPANWAARA